MTLVCVYVQLLLTSFPHIHGTFPSQNHLCTQQGKSLVHHLLLWTMTALHSYQVVKTREIQQSFTSQTIYHSTIHTTLAHSHRSTHPCRPAATLAHPSKFPCLKDPTYKEPVIGFLSSPLHTSTHENNRTLSCSHYNWVNFHSSITALSITENTYLATTIHTWMYVRT